MTERIRPESVPKTAVFDPDAGEGWEWVEVEKDPEGRPHGICREWTLAGHHHGTCEYDHGVLLENFNYHPDGSLSSHQDKSGNTTTFRATSESPEQWPEVGDDVVRIVSYSHDGLTHYTVRYFDKNDVEIQPTGVSLPERPESVDIDARFFSQHGWWVLGSTMIWTHLLVGPWTRWMTDGTIHQEELRTDDGQRIEMTTYENGKIKGYERYFPGEKLQIRRSYYENVSYEKVNDIEGRCIQESSWYSKDHAFDEEKLFFYDGDQLVKVREREAPGYVSYEATMQADGKMLCEFFSIEGVRTISGYVEEGMLVGVWNLHAENANIDMTGMEVSVNPKNSSLSYSIYSAFFDDSLTALTTSLDKDFLIKLDAIDWENAESCYGDSNSVRDGIIGLTSPLSIIRSTAMGRISGETLHQGSLYEVTALAIPFLIELLVHPNADPELVLTQLRWYAEAAKPYAEQALEAKVEIEEGDDDWTIGVLGSLAAISAGWENIVKFSNNANLVDEVISLAKYGPVAAKEFLFEHAKSEEPLKRAIAVDAIAGFSEFAENDLLLFLEDDSAVVRLVAALRTAMQHNRETPKRFVDELVKSLDNYEDVQDLYYQILSSDSHVLAEIVYALACVRSDQTQERLGWICDNIEKVDGTSAILYGQALLMLALGRVGDPFAKTFTEVMKTLAKSKQFNVFNVNAREVLDMWLLPDDQDLFNLAEEMEKKENPEAAMRSWLEARMN